MKKILLICTGGTIASVRTELGLAPGITADELVNIAPGIRNICDVDAIQLFSLDSTNIKHEHWVEIAECIEENYNNYDGFVISHGTDTMAYTAAALSYLVQNSIKPIVLTGAQKPVGEVGSDVESNLLDAFTVACDNDSHDVQIVFSGSVICGTRARKNYSKSYFAFESINYPERAKVEDGRVIHFITERAGGEVKFYETLNSNVGLIKLVPGMRRDVLHYIIDKHDGLIIESFGVGGLPEYSDYFELVSEAVDNGKLVVMTTQVPHEGSNLSVYTVGSRLKNCPNVFEAFDMTTEAAFVKLQWVLAHAADADEARRLFYKPIDHDILYSEDK